jgi:LPS sulfotransferase NodH
MKQDNQIQRIAEDITELKVVIAKQEVNAGNMNKILDRLTESVEVHVRRSDSLEKLVELVRTETSAKIEAEMKPIKAHIHFIKGAMWAIGGVGALLLALDKMGILQKLINL